MEGKHSTRSKFVCAILPKFKDLEETKPNVLPVRSSIKTKYQHKNTGLELLNSLQLSKKKM